VVLRQQLIVVGQPNILKINEICSGQNRPPRSITF
jgi:hypothetical protein